MWCPTVRGEGCLEILISAVGGISVFVPLLSLYLVPAMHSLERVMEHLVIPDKVEVLESRVEGKSGSFEYLSAQGVAALAGV